MDVKLDIQLKVTLLTTAHKALVTKNTFFVIKKVHLSVPSFFTVYEMGRTIFSKMLLEGLFSG
jgi:hypothetical protein